MTWQIVAAVGIFLTAYVFIATEKLPKVPVTLTGAALMVLIGATDAEHTFYSHDSGVDWDVIFLLLGMMIIVGIARHSGMFEYVAVWSAKVARGRPFFILAMFATITAVLSALLDNVTTVLLIVPVTLLVCQRLAVPAVPYIITEVMASNIGGTSTLIGDPPNLIIGSRGGLGFADFAGALGPIVLILIVVLIGLVWLMFGRRLRYDPERAAKVMALRERDTIRDRRLLVMSLVVIGLVLAGFLTSRITHLAPSIVALLGAGVLILLARPEPRRIFGDVEWETLLFFAGLFVMVGSLVNLGIIEMLGGLAVEAIGDNWAAGATGLVVGSAALSGIIDNIPYVATMAPLTSDLVSAGGDAAQPLWWALALGADLGGNATAIGASANVVALGIAQRNGHHITFWQFTKYGLITTAITVAISAAYVWLRWYA
ncbi:ArsB/NhaD family transporter [Myceligenerans indicum]|uniref:ArsB/NhaD family transporter n=1 Tax=Myceligenerans indicum TaxID=2593663 RepID=A0ABS1LFV4_9MICO|nr:ArsB/NhaD family transporter [Myceligenerans indicum]MBL0884934.1 ArsB/NhaD family transporter [Myceligenerans indicum]